MLTVRDWTIEDIAAIAEMERRCFADAWSAELLADVLKYPFLHGILLEEDGRIVGYGCLRVLFEAADVDNIAVDSPYRGRGYGEKLLGILLDRARSLGARECLLEVRVSNAAAIGLYQKYGFLQIAVRKKYYEDGEDALVMQKTL